jgi:hypothetical protein
MFVAMVYALISLQEYYAGQGEISGSETGEHEDGALLEYGEV